MELSILCDCEVALIIYNSNNKLYQYSSTDLKKILSRIDQFGENGKELTNDDVCKIFLKNCNLLKFLNFSIFSIKEFSLISLKEKRKTNIQNLMKRMKDYKIVQDYIIKKVINIYKISIAKRIKMI